MVIFKLDCLNVFALKRAVNLLTFQLIFSLGGILSELTTTFDEKLRDIMGPFYQEAQDSITMPGCHQGADRRKSALAAPTLSSSQESSNQVMFKSIDLKQSVYNPFRIEFRQK